MKKLVEEIVHLGCESNCDAYVNGKCQVSTEYRERRCLPFIEATITLVLSAVRDGRLDEELIEEIAALEHEQWITWSKSVADEVSSERRARWETYWIPYEELSEEVKEHDRIWARKIIALRGIGKEE